MSTPIRKIYVAPFPQPESEKEQQGSLLRRYFLPHQGTRLMSEESNRSGLFIPYPLLAIIMVLVTALGGGIIGLYSQLSAMNTTMIMRDADHQQQVKELKERQELQLVYITDLREKVIRLEVKKGS